MHAKIFSSLTKAQVVHFVTYRSDKSTQLNSFSGLLFSLDSVIVAEGLQNHSELRSSLMRANEKIVCPVCHEASMAKLHIRREGFAPVGEELRCMLCGAVLGTPEATGKTAAGEAKLRDLSLLLGAAPAAPARLAAASTEQRFCKDCVHFLAHPFVSRCALDQHAIEDAMGDCPRYAVRQA